MQTTGGDGQTYARPPTAGGCAPRGDGCADRDPRLGGFEVAVGRERRCVAFGDFRALIAPPESACFEAEAPGPPSCASAPGRPAGDGRHERHDAELRAVG